jgi:hypothetical protein
VDLVHHLPLFYMTRMPIVALCESMNNTLLIGTIEYLDATGISKHTQKKISFKMFNLIFPIIRCFVCLQ